MIAEYFARMLKANDTIAVKTTLSTTIFKRKRFIKLNLTNDNVNSCHL